MRVEQHGKIRGRMKAEILDGKTGEVVKAYPWQRNLILDSGLDYFFINGSPSCFDKVLCAVAGTGTSPNSIALDGTFSQAGSTVTRSTGTGVFAAGDVGKRIKFADGSRAKIATFTSTTQVEVDESQSVSAQALTIYNTSRTALESQVDSTSTRATSAGTTLQEVDLYSQDTTEKKTWIFPIRESAINYTEIGFCEFVTGTNLFSRIVLDAPISVDIGQQLRVAYECTLADAAPIVAFDDELTITGWPRPYNIESITSTASDFTVTLSEDHHFEVGGVLNISGALPVKTDISAISSTASDFTVTTSAAHGLSVSDSIDIEDCTVTAYNGTWTVATVPDSTSYTVTSAANPGAASDGTSRKSVPGTWYDGEWTISSVPGTDRVTITSSINPISAGGDGTAFNNLKCSVVHPRHGFRCGQNLGGSYSNEIFLYAASRCDAKLARDSEQWTFSGFPQYTICAGTANISDNSVKIAGGDGITNTITFGIDTANYTDIRELSISIGRGTKYATIVISFDEPQRKDSGYQLIITVFRKLHADLS